MQLLIERAINAEIERKMEDTSVNFLILIALRWSARQRSHVGMVLAAILLIPSLATLWTAWGEVFASCATRTAPAHSNWSGGHGREPYLRAHACRLRHSGGSLTRAAFLSARNDVLANVAIVGAGVVTAYSLSAWPDLVVGLGIFLLNLDAAREVYIAARRERASAAP